MLLLSGLFWYALRRWSPVSRAELLPGKEDDNAYSKLQFEIDDGAAAGARGGPRLLRLCRGWKPSSIFLVACILSRVLVFGRVARVVECSWDGVEVWSNFKAVWTS